MNQASLRFAVRKHHHTSTPRNNRLHIQIPLFVRRRRIARTSALETIIEINQEGHLGVLGAVGDVRNVFPRLQIDTARHPSAVDVESVDGAGDVAVAAEPAIDARELAAAERVRQQLLAAVDEGLHEGEVGEPHDVVGQDRVEAGERLVGEITDGLKRLDDAVALLDGEEVLEHEAAGEEGHVEFLDAIDGGLRRIKKTAFDGGNEDGGVVDAGSSFICC